MSHGSSIRFLNISQIALMFEMSRPTVRGKLKKANVLPINEQEHPPLYDMAKVGPALFSTSQTKLGR